MVLSILSCDLADVLVPLGINHCNLLPSVFYLYVVARIKTQDFGDLGRDNNT